MYVVHAWVDSLPGLHFGSIRFYVGPKWIMGCSLQTQIEISSGDAVNGLEPDRNPKILQMNIAYCYRLFGLLTIHLITLNNFEKSNKTLISNHVIAYSSLALTHTVTTILSQQPAPPHSQVTLLSLSENVTTPAEVSLSCHLRRRLPDPDTRSRTSLHCRCRNQVMPHDFFIMIP
ncbi:hypothetical protein ACOSQ2_000794 [Xanthoceras sorbifolium]